MNPLKRKSTDRNYDDCVPYDLNNSPTYQESHDGTNPFAPFANLQTQWKTDLRNTSFYIARLPSRATSISSSRRCRERHRQQKRVLDSLGKIRRVFFQHTNCAEDVLLDQTYYSLDLESDSEEIVRGLRYVVVRWESFLKRNTLENLQSGKWVKEVGVLVNQMVARLCKIRQMLEEIEEAREDRDSERRRFYEVEEIWKKDYEALLEQEIDHKTDLESSVGTRMMWVDWNNYFDRRLGYLDNKRELVRHREGDRYREHRDWIVMTEKMDIAFEEWIQWRDERGPEEVELRDGSIMGIF